MKKLTYLLLLLPVLFVFANCASTEVLDDETLALCDEHFGESTPVETYRHALIHPEHGASEFRIATARDKRDFTWRISRMATKSNGRYAFEIPDQSLDRIRGAFERAAKSWADVAEVTFQETTGQADIYVFFKDIDNAGNTLAYAYLPGSTKKSIVMDIREAWSLRPRNFTQVDLETVFFHELGHWLGILHSDVRGAIMYPSYEGVRRKPASDDKDAIRRLYGDRMNLWMNFIFN